MLFQHTVRNNTLKCDYCGYTCSELMNLCKHISTEHSEMFRKKDSMEDKCDMCYLQFDSREKVTSHMNDNHSPESFYAKIVEDISGECRICKKYISFSEMESHFQIVHKEVLTENSHAQDVLQILLDIIAISVMKCDELRSDK